MFSHSLSSVNSVRILNLASNWGLLLLFSTLLILPELLAGQPDRAIDSIQSLIQKADDQQERYRLTIALSDWTRRSQTDSTITFLNASVEEARKWASTEEEQMVLTDLIIALGNAYTSNRDFNNAFLAYQEGYNRVINEGDPNRVLTVTTLLGKGHMRIRQLDSAEYYLNIAVEQANQFGSLREKAVLLRTLGATAGRRRDFTATIDYYQQALDIFLKLEDDKSSAHAYLQIGATHYFSSNLPLAIETLLKSLSLAKKAEFLPVEDEALGVLVDIYYSLGDLETAGVYILEEIKSYKAVHGEEKSKALTELEGQHAFIIADYPAAIRLLTECLSLKQGRFFDESVSHFFLGEAYLELNELDSAMVHLQASLAKSDIYPVDRPRINNLVAIGEVQKRKNRINEAISTNQEAYALARKSALIEQEMSVSEALYELYKIKGEESMALAFFERSTLIKDSLFDAQVVADVTRLNAQHEFDQEKQALLFQQEQENIQQEGIRRLLWVGVAFLVLILAIGAFFFWAKQQSNKQLQSLNQELTLQKDIVEQQKKKLEELDESKSRFFTNISHEFRTPLTIIKGMMEKIREKPDVHLEKGSQMIQRNTLNLLNLVNQILDLRKLESKELQLKPRKGEVISYLKYVTESHTSYAEQKGLLLKVDTELEELTMDYDGEKLLRVLSNLLSNAIKFTPMGGAVTVWLGNNMLAGKETLQIRVIDTGIGIAKENLPYVFDRFYQEDNSPARSGEGTGIGLALSQELVQLMGGEIVAVSEPNQGSIFTISLPVTRVAATEDAVIVEETAVLLGAGQNPVEEVPKVEAMEPGKPNLLLVEDNTDVQQYLVAALEDYYNIDLAENGAIGIEKAIETIPDLIISDIMMPEKDGYALTDELKNDERTDHIPILLLTAKSDDESRISGLEKGADAYLAKPFDERELLIRIDKLLELRRKLQERYSTLGATVEEQQPIEDPFLQKLYEYVEAHLAEATLNMDQISKAMGMSRTQVFRKLKALTGKSATLFIRSIRLKKGRQLLLTSDLTISEVGYEVGFTSLSYFSKAFLEEFGIRPSNVRQ